MGSGTHFIDKERGWEGWDVPREKGSPVERVRDLFEIKQGPGGAKMR